MINSRLYYKIRSFFRYQFDRRYRHDVVRTKLSRSWHDIDEVMLHANFALLERFVEFEHNGEDKLQERIDYLTGPEAVVDYPHTPDEGGSIASWADPDIEALRLYKWWKYDWPALQKQLAECNMYEYGRLEQQIADEEDAALLALIKIRRTLWT